MKLDKALPDLMKVLVGEHLVDAHIVVAPRKMGRGDWLLAGTGASCYCVDAHVVSQEATTCKRK